MRTPQSSHIHASTSIFKRSRSTVALCLCGFISIAIDTCQAQSSSQSRSSLILIDRTIGRRATSARGSIEHGSGWRIEYRFRYESDRKCMISPVEIQAVVDGFVSNSRIPGHSMAIRSNLAITTASDSPSTTELIPSLDESKRCRERGSLRVWKKPEIDAAIVRTGDDDFRRNAPIIEAPRSPQEPLAMAPGSTIYVEINLEHIHDLFGSYDPLLGARTLDLTIGDAHFHDSLVLNREPIVESIESAWTTIPADRTDNRHFVSAPDSLHLQAHIPGDQAYRYPDRSVRRGTKMKLTYWYLIAPGTRGECRARLSQYRDTPTTWRVLDQGAIDENLTVIGRWTKVERVFRADSEATSVALEYRINECEIGEVWIDDVSLEPMIAFSPKGP